MKILEVLYRDILHSFFTEGTSVFQQKELARKFHCSVSTVFHALKAPRRIGAVKVTGRNFSLADAEKLLTYWATRRRLSSEILYETRSPDSAAKREGQMPPDVIFGCYSAYRLLYGNTPADYDKVYVYAESADEIKARFPKSKGPPNLAVLKADPFLASYGQMSPPVQVAADLWNLTDWYARDFLAVLRRRLFGERGG